MAKRDRVDWKGYIPAVTTPFLDDDSLDLNGLGGLLEWLHGEGMHGLFIGGTTGEWSSLKPHERKQLFDAAGSQMKGKLPILAGCTSFTPDATIELAEHARLAGFDGVVVAPPPYIRPNEEEVFAYYRTVSAGVKLPLVVYNWPAGTGVDMSIELLTRIATLDAVVGIKQSSPQLERFFEAYFALKQDVRVFGFMMDELGLAVLEARGGDGTIGAGGVLGRYQPDFYNNLWGGDIDAARACGQKDVKVLMDWYTPELIGCFGAAPAVMKAGLQMRGVPIARHVRAPLLDVRQEDLAPIRQTLIDVGLIEPVPA